MKWHGVVGFGITQETRPGVWEVVMERKTYYGDVIRNTRRYTPSSTLNDNLDISNMISIVADAYAYNNFHAMRYVEFMGANWKITNVEVQRPRLLLTIGGVYNESST